MPSIQKRGDVFRAFVTKSGVRKSKTFENKSEALAWASSLERDIDLGLKVGDNSPKGKTFHGMLDRFYKEECPKRDGCEWERKRINRFKKDWKDRKLSLITSEDISKWRNARLEVTRKIHGEERAIRPASVRRDMTLLKTIFDTAVNEWKWLKENPMDWKVKEPFHVNTLSASRCPLAGCSVAGLWPRIR